jgi:hypothetical protein
MDEFLRIAKDEMEDLQKDLLVSLVFSMEIITNTNII